MNRLRAAKAACSKAQEKAIAAAKVTHKLVHDHPYAALGVGVVLGAVIGLLIKRRDREY